MANLPDTPDHAEAESRARTGVESPPWSGPPQPPAEPPAWDGPPIAADPPAWDGRNPPVLPRRVPEASLVPRLRDGPPACSSLPGRFPGPRLPTEAEATAPAIQHGSERERPIPGPAAGAPQEPGAAGVRGADPGGAPGAGGTQGAHQQDTPGDEEGPQGPG